MLSPVVVFDRSCYNTIDITWRGCHGLPYHCWCLVLRVGERALADTLSIKLRSSLRSFWFVVVFAWVRFASHHSPKAIVSVPWLTHSGTQAHFVPFRSLWCPLFFVLFRFIRHKTSLLFTGSSRLSAHHHAGVDGSLTKRTAFADARYHGTWRSLDMTLIHEGNSA